jgi:3-oxoacyl-[acyl-carrier-protein] synthase II
MADDVVITGLGIVSPIGRGEHAFWDALRTGRSGAGPVDALDTSELPRKLACQVREDIDAPPELGRATRLAIDATQQAITSAGLASTGARRRLPDEPRCHVIVGTTMGETEFIEGRLAEDASRWLSDDHMKQIARGCPGSIAGNVRRHVGGRAEATDLYGACAAGNMAIGMARRHLLEGRCDIALAGGADGFSRLAFIGFMRLRVMASEVCRPFDQARDGLFVGEGAAMFVMERASDARARGANIRARVIGCGQASENYHPTRPEPNGDGLTRATQAALAQAGVSPEDIGYVCAHGTGTPQNDAIEVKVLQTCFPKGVRFSSIKALTGHPMGAAAALEAACCILSIEHQLLIPTWHLENVLEPCTSEAMRGQPLPASFTYAVNNSAGFGGYNSSIVLAAA